LSPPTRPSSVCSATARIPNGILFVDDNAANVDAGARYGWMTSLFLDAADFAQLLHSVGLLDGRSGRSRSGSASR
jgi:hypothetical protein